MINYCSLRGRLNSSDGTCFNLLCSSKLSPHQNSFQQVELRAASIRYFFNSYQSFLLVFFPRTFDIVLQQQIRPLNMSSVAEI